MRGICYDWFSNGCEDILGLDDGGQEAGDWHHRRGADASHHGPQ